MQAIAADAQKDPHSSCRPLEVDLLSLLDGGDDVDERRAALGAFGARAYRGFRARWWCRFHAARWTARARAEAVPLPKMASFGSCVRCGGTAVALGTASNQAQREAEERLERQRQSMTAEHADALERQRATLELAVAAERSELRGRCAQLERQLAAAVRAAPPPAI